MAHLCIICMVGLTPCSGFMHIHTCYIASYRYYFLYLSYLESHYYLLYSHLERYPYTSDIPRVILFHA